MKLFGFFKKNKVHQVKNSTSFDRYPVIFNLTKEYFLQTQKAPTILSYGCSTGEECFSLRNYFPASTIFGLDIDEKNIEIATKKKLDNKINFFHSNPRNLKSSGPYDLIFCMSVLCRWPDTQNTDDASAHFSFENFESSLTEICKNLNSKGLLIIYNANYRFGDSKLAEGFTVLENDVLMESGFVHKFNRKSKKDNEEVYRDCIFIKK